MLFTIMNEEVGRFDILVDNLAGMGMLQSAGRLLEKIPNILWGEQCGTVALLEPISERAFFAVGHNHIGQGGSIDTFLTKVIEGQDVRVVKGDDGSHLALEEASSLFGGVGVGISGRFSSDDLDRDLAMNADVFGEVDF